LVVGNGTIWSIGGVSGAVGDQKLDGPGLGGFLAWLAYPHECTI
jgi:hypothetical protein